MRSSLNQGGATTFRQRTIAEAVRLLEEQRGRALPDPPMAPVEGDLETRIIARAQALPQSSEIDRVLHKFANTMRLAVALFIALSGLAGAATARAVMSPQAGDAVNIYWVLGGLLGMQLAALLAWLVLLMFRPSGDAMAPLGSLVFAAGKRLATWLQKTSTTAAGLAAASTTTAKSGAGKWRLSAATHALWLAFTAGALAMLLLLMATRQYTFYWETTILSERTYTPMTEAIGFLPGLLGFQVPTEAQVAASQRGIDKITSSDGTNVWPQFLVGALCTYGLIPRFVLVLVCLSLARRAEARYRLDLSQPGYLRLRPILQPFAKKIGVTDPAGPVPSPPAAARPAPASPAGESPALLGLEIAAPKSGWPPPVGTAFSDIGIIDGHADRDRALHDIAARIPAPNPIVVVCDLTTTPDRGIGAFLRKIRDVQSSRLALLLTAGDRQRHRGSRSDLQSRIADWRKLGTSIGIGDADIHELDLDHLTTVTRRQLAGILGTVESADPAPVFADQISAAFAVIRDHARQWSTPPDTAAQAELHQAIANLYAEQSASLNGRLWPTIPAIENLQLEDLTGHVQTGARRIVDLLPARLRLNTKWLTAGAVAGAMGCVSAAALVSPLAITALPLWAGFGSVISGVIANTLSASDTEAPIDGAANGGFDMPIRSAALFAVLLELQGLPETEISGILDRTFVDDDGTISGVTEAEPWLECTRRRFADAVSEVKSN